MLCLMLVGSALLTASPEEAAAPPTAATSAYQEAKARAGRDPDAQVKLALWCEAHGLPTERMIHLARAVLADPSHAAARGLMGMVAYQGRWEKPEAVADRVQADAKLTATLAEYNDRRARSKNTADSQWDLALWCEAHDLKPEATAHLTAVTRLDPKRDAAWKRLGYKKHDGRWMTDNQIAAEKADRKAQAKADAHWRPLLETWKGMLSDTRTRDEAEAALAGVTDPRAVPSVWKVFASGSVSDQRLAVQILGQIDAPAASRCLAALAIFSNVVDVRRSAIETLRRRDPREYAGPLIQLVQDPLKYEVKPVGGPGSPGVLFVEGQRYNLQRVYQAPAPPLIPRLFNDSVPFNPFDGSQYWAPPGLAKWMVVDESVQQNHALARLQGRIPWGGGVNRIGVDQFRSPSVYKSPKGGLDMTAIAIHRDVMIGLNQREAQRVAANSQQRLAADIAAVEVRNRSIHESNSRLLPILTSISGVDLGEDRESWSKWYIDQQGYSTLPSTSTKPTFVQQAPFDSPIWYGLRTVSCFGAGTLVHSLFGPRPIEEIRVGDRLLSRDTESGALSYQPVLVVHHNPPSKTLRITLADEVIVSSTFHRFWHAGRGWAMARDLQPGDTLRTLNGLARVVAVEEDQVQPVFNLDVARNRTFFVGQGATLVHDNSVPSLRAGHFDAPPDLAAIAPSRD